MTTIRQLYDLQELDWELARFTTELESVEARLRDDSALLKARAETLEREQSLQKVRSQHTRQSQEVQQLQEKLQLVEQRLYGGSVRIPRELEDLQAEMQYAKEHVKDGEEPLLNLMLELDEKERQAAKAKMDMTQMEATWSETQATLTKERAALAERLHGLRGQRQQLTLGIAPTLVARYEQIRIARQGYAVAKVERGMCTGCRLTLPTKDLQRVRTAQEPVACSSCGRILYMS